MSDGSEMWRRREGMRDEGEQGMDGWMAGGMDRERGGDADVFLSTEFYCTHSVPHTTSCRAGRCNKATHAAKHTHRHKNTWLLLGLSQYQGSRDVHVFA